MLTYFFALGALLALLALALFALLACANNPVSRTQMHHTTSRQPTLNRGTFLAFLALLSLGRFLGLHCSFQILQLLPH
jgi:hypothetical protein